MNVGLMAMIVLSLLPVGLLQTVASVEHGYWYARSSEFLGQGLMQTLRWLRMPGDTLFAIGRDRLRGLHFRGPSVSGYSSNARAGPRAPNRRAGKRATLEAGERDGRSERQVTVRSRRALKKRRHGSGQGERVVGRRAQPTTMRRGRQRGPPEKNHPGPADTGPACPPRTKRVGISILSTSRNGVAPAWCSPSAVRSRHQMVADCGPPPTRARGRRSTSRCRAVRSTVPRATRRLIKRPKAAHEPGVPRGWSRSAPRRASMICGRPLGSADTGPCARST